MVVVAADVVFNAVRIIMRFNIIIAPNGHGQWRLGLVRWIAMSMMVRIGAAMALVGGFRWKLFAIASRAEHYSIGNEIEDDVVY